ncbi:hypothetical protein BC833DRAFT_586375, partial [Globomyces pollinis-pini]
LFLFVLSSLAKETFPWNVQINSSFVLDYSCSVGPCLPCSDLADDLLCPNGFREELFCTPALLIPNAKTPPQYQDCTPLLDSQLEFSKVCWFHLINFVVLFFSGGIVWFKLREHHRQLYQKLTNQH